MKLLISLGLAFLLSYGAMAQDLQNELESLKQAKQKIERSLSIITVSFLSLSERMKSLQLSLKTLKQSSKREIESINNSLALLEAQKKTLIKDKVRLEKRIAEYESSSESSTSLSEDFKKYKDSVEATIGARNITIIILSAVSATLLGTTIYLAIR